MKKRGAAGSRARPFVGRTKPAVTRTDQLNPHGQVEPQRTVGPLLQRAQQIQVQARRKQAEEAETKRIQELEILAPRGDQAWQEVETLIQKSRSKAYDEAIQLLAKLRELAMYQGQEAIFQQRLNWIYRPYSSRSSLLRRLR